MYGRIPVRREIGSFARLPETRPRPAPRCDRRQRASGDVAELADLVEVVYALVKAKGLTIAQFEALGQSKVDQRGAFDQRLFLVEVSD